MKRTVFLFIALLAMSAPKALAQDDFDKEFGDMIKDFDNTMSKEFAEFEKFYNECNKKFAEGLRKEWKQQEAEPEKPKPIEKEVPPVVYSEKTPIKFIPTPQPIKEVVKPRQPKPQPMPIKPIQELPVMNKPVHPTKSFTFFGTNEKLRYDEEECHFRLHGVKEGQIADAWMELSDKKYLNMIHDCLKIREERRLSDWAYLQMLHEAAETICGQGTNEATLMMAFIYCQSGYKMRLGQADGKLRMLYACDYDIYNKAYYTIGKDKYYVFGDEPQSLFLCKNEFKKENSMSLIISKTADLDWKATNVRTLKSTRYPDMKATVSCNKNAIDFFNTYPSSEYGNNFMTRWAMYANTPFEQEIKETLYPELRAAIRGLDEKQAVEKLLNWVQTSLVYEYDDKVWGADRAFFPEETLFYPYADCEDRSILFTRLVRDLLNLKCVLVYYPGHLASAVHFNERIPGDFLNVNGQSYTICDPTFINAGVGATMTSMKGKPTTVILLE